MLLGDAQRASSSVVAAPLRGTSTPISASLSQKILRSSVASMVAIGVPRTLTPYFAERPAPVKLQDRS